MISLRVGVERWKSLDGRGCAQHYKNVAKNFRLELAES
jgi:hypothetical protein